MYPPKVVRVPPRLTRTTLGVLRVRLGRIAKGDFGSSFHDGRQVSRTIREALWPTISVALISWFLTLTLSVPTWIYSAVHQGGPFDRISSTTLYMLLAIPNYVMGIMHTLRDVLDPRLQQPRPQ